ncbi:phospholipase D-like domain-containing protein [Chitinophaga sp. GbtcB8]|uniref:phospholipase D-like domain-containing protein n=1 Tax=Chitinophaga sp. GbtcB8 TaxID=2824753 RepID=UPI001C308D5F|nr:phospholipase D-like domain-containing protein [Chitinophaga sp. GbtcB8]
MQTVEEILPVSPDLFGPVITVIKANQEALLTLPGVLGVRPGFSKSNRGEDPVPVITVVTKPDAGIVPLPESLEGIPLEAEVATPLDLVEGLIPLSIWEGYNLEAAPHINYQPPDPNEVALTAMEVKNVTCHVGPDSGWTTLQPFLEETTTSLTVAMYEFYATHIIDTITTLGQERGATLSMILQVDKNDLHIVDTLSQSWGERLEFVKASVSGANRIFNNSYHTKVAVRDSSAFWLSSGNWSPHSQPLITPGNEQFLYKEGNREWHVIIEDRPLAEMYEKFIRYDMRQATGAVIEEAFFELPDLFVPDTLAEAEAAVIQPQPFAAETFYTNGEVVKVKPLMSPDNYAAEVLKLIEAAEESLYLQFSYIRQPSAEIFDRIIAAIAQKMEAGLDVKVIVGPSQKAEHSDLLIGTRKWKRSMFRRQSSKVHNKGILIDGKIAVVGSNNWSSDGTQYNRDTSLVFFSPQITAYYTAVFMFDWNSLTKPISQPQETTPLIAPENAPAPPGMRRVSWQEWYDA